MSSWKLCHEICLQIIFTSSQNGAMSSRDQPLQKVSTKKTSKSIDKLIRTLYTLVFIASTLLSVRISALRFYNVGQKFESVKSLFFPVLEFSKKGRIATEDLQSEQGGVHNQQGCKVLPRYKKFKPGIKSSYEMQNSPQVPQNLKNEMIFFSPCPILSPTEEKYRIFLSIFTITFCINM